MLDVAFVHAYSLLRIRCFSARGLITVPPAQLIRCLESRNRGRHTCAHVRRKPHSKNRLAPNHGWRAQPGHKIVVLGRGAVRVEVPDAWVVEVAEDCVKAFDKKPPDDDCVLAVSYHLWPRAGQSLSPASLVQSALESDERALREITPAIEDTRIDTTLAWAQGTFVDARIDREAYARLCIARREEIQALVTFDFWVSDLAWCHPQWTAILASLQLGQWVADPLRGPTLS